MAATAAGVLLSSLTHKSVSTSHHLADMPSSNVNIVHLHRPMQQQQQQPVSKLLVKPGLKAVIDVQHPEAATEYLLSAVTCPTLQQRIHADLNQAVQSISNTLQLEHVQAKLQIITAQSCPKWHADSVGIRMLCTYAGPGTWYAANRHVKRSYNLFTGDVSIAAVDDAHACQTGQGDMLFLKGNAFPGLYGAGAVHKSPELLEGEARLLLTVDDACC